MDTMTAKTIEDIRPSDRAQLTRRITRADVLTFAGAVGDANPLHTDPAYAARTVFETPIVPGLFTAGLISAVLGTLLPGPGAVYLSQTLKFLKPVHVGDTITARVEVCEVLRDRQRVHVGTTCENQHGERVLSGDAWVMLPAATLARAA